MRLVVWLGFAFIQQGVQMAKRGEAGLFQSDGFFDQLFDRAPLNMAIEPGLSPYLATKQFVDRNVEELALDVPQRDVDRRHRAGDRAAGEVIGAQHHVPVMLDREWVFAYEVVAILGDRGGGGFQLAPGARLAQSDDAGIGVDADIEEAIQQERFDFGDFHYGVSSRHSDGSFVAIHRARAAWTVTGSSCAIPWPGRAP